MAMCRRSSRRPHVAAPAAAGARLAHVRALVLRLLLGAAALGQQLSVEGARLELLWDHDWRFHRGECPQLAQTAATMASSVSSASASDTERAGTARSLPPPPALDTCASPVFDDAAWRSLSLPHDWSRENLPARNVDREFPVVGARYGAWKLRAGDCQNASWAAPGLDDSDWIPAKGGDDWRAYGAAFQRVNATGWYRQQLAPTLVSGFMLNTSRPLTLSLGIIAGADQTYLNGPSPALALKHCSSRSRDLAPRPSPRPRARAPLPPLSFSLRSPCATFCAPACTRLRTCF